MERSQDMQVRRDESFKRPGAIPFDWELHPGVPKPDAEAPEPTYSCPPTPSRLNPPPQLVRYASPIPSWEVKDESSFPRSCFAIPSVKSRGEKVVKPRIKKVWPNRSVSDQSLTARPPHDGMKFAMEVDMATRWQF